MTKKILLTGYIGRENFGDDLLLKIALDNIKKIKNNEVYCIVPETVDALYLLQYYPKIKIIRYKKTIPVFFYKSFDKVYFIGGGVFFDYGKEINTKNYFKRKISNYLRYNIPKLLGTKYAGIGIGIGPFINKRSQSIYQSMLKNFDFLGVRDQKSYEYGKLFDLKKVYLANDLSLLLRNELTALKRSKTACSVIICPRSYKHYKPYEKHLEVLMKFSEHLLEKQYQVNWCFFQSEEEKIMEKLESKGILSTVWNPYKMTIMDFVSLFKNASIVFTSRMHMVYVAGLLGINTVSIRVDPKLEYAARLFNRKPKILDPLTNLDRTVAL